MPVRILVVDDDRAVRESLRRSLEFNGYDVALAADGAEALAGLSAGGPAGSPDVVVMDVMMPNMDGVTALGLLRARETAAGHHTPVLMVTAHAMTGDRERFLAAGADGYVSKPLSPDELCKEIDRVVAHARTGA